MGTFNGLKAYHGQQREQNKNISLLALHGRMILVVDIFI